jgi:pimeloyl-ACP methyl ester carboxylesterase
MSLDLPKIHAKEKKALLFLHGYMSSGKSFAYQTKFFSSYFTVYAPDLTGFGENEYMPYPFSLDDYAKWVKDYMTANGIVKPHIIAHSFGGRVAIKLSSTYPDLFDKIVLTGSAGLKPRRTAKYHFKRCAFKLLKPFVKKEKLKKFYSKDYLALNPVMKQSFNKIINEHLDDLLPKITNQTLIINGKNDTETPLYTAKRLKRGIKNSQIFIIENAGHFCFIEKANLFNIIVREFLT